MPDETELLTFKEFTDRRLRTKLMAYGFKKFTDVVNPRGQKLPELTWQRWWTEYLEKLVKGEIKRT